MKVSQWSREVLCMIFERVLSALQLTNTKHKHGPQTSSGLLMEKMMTTWTVGIATNLKLKEDTVFLQAVTGLGDIKYISKLIAPQLTVESDSAA